jgi:hypothetical protein
MTQRATNVRYDSKREERIIETILHGAGTPEEQQAAWYRHLKMRLSFPIGATYRGCSGTKPLCLGAKVAIIGLARPEYCQDSIYVRVMDGQASIRLSLTLLTIDDEASENAVVVADWRYWQARYFPQ